MDGPVLPGIEDLYDNAPCGLLLASADGVIVHANGTIGRWLGLHPTEVCGRKVEDLLTAGGRIFYRTHLEPLIRMQGTVAEVKLDLRPKVGNPIPMLLNLAERPWRGRPLLQIALFVVADRHKYERELLAQRQRAEALAEKESRSQAALDAARGEAEQRAEFAEKLVGMVSHDIRNPLSVIHMSTILLDKLGLTEKQRPVISRVQRSVEQVQHLIADLLDFTQARLGHGLAVHPRELDLRETMVQHLAELSMAFPDRRLVHTHTGERHCTADPHRILQAVGNLVANAATHGARDRPIEVHSEVSDGECMVRVRNEGPVIPPETMARLFEPMVRGEGRPAGSGIGLGLYIVREIALRHGGRVEVASSAEGGTAFTLRWPAVRAASGN